MKLNISGLGDIQKQLSKVQKEIEKAVNGEAKLDEIFTDDFMRKNTKFNTIDDFFDNSPFKVKTINDYQALDDKELDPYVAENTNFNNWNDFAPNSSQLIW